jgi:cell shape-determining protein MreC
LFFAIANYKKTKLFYRINLYIVILSAIVLSFLLGILMFHLGLAQKTEEFSEKYIPFYDRYLKIQNIKKEIFIKKLKKIGVTNDILEKNPNLKEKVSEKFDKNVLGKIYLYKKPGKCLKENFVCKSDEIFFSDKKGCGCREVYFDLK